MGKKYDEASKLVEKGKIYEAKEAVALLKKLGVAKFDETIDLSVRLGIDPKKSDQQVRGTVSLPHGLGKKVRIAVIAKGEKVKEAEDAGAEITGGEELIQKIEGGWIDFDVLIATPDLMPKVGKLGKVLGRRGLMPSPKNGTVAADVKKAVTEFKAGKLEFKADKFGIVHVPIGKISFSEDKIYGNFLEVYRSLVKSKPSSSKGVFIRSLALSPTMGPSVRIETVVKS
jgi:large subunit ribosomal protein L1